MDTLRRALLFVALTTTLTGCNELLRESDDARVEGALVLTDSAGVETILLQGTLDHQDAAIACATPSYARGPIGVVSTGEGAEQLEFAVHVIEEFDADDAPEAVGGAFRYGGQDYTLDEDYGCDIALDAYDESGWLTVAIDCGLRDGAGDAVVLQGALSFHECFRDRELIVRADDPLEGFISAVVGADSETVRTAVLIPVVIVAVGAGGGH